MKKKKVIKILNKGIELTEICCCYFTYDKNYYCYYPNLVNEKFLVGQEEDDFLLDGYHIRKISQLKRVEIKDDLCNIINKSNGLTKKVEAPNINISSWRSIFNSLKKLNKFIIIEDAINEQFAIGLIKKIGKRKVHFYDFDADGIWQENLLEIPYSSITSVSWGTRYAENWENYLRNCKP